VSSAFYSLHHINVEHPSFRPKIKFTPLVCKERVLVEEHASQIYFSLSNATFVSVQWLRGCFHAPFFTDSAAITTQPLNITKFAVGPKRVVNQCKMIPKYNTIICTDI
jgi:hypothetical protein